MRQTGRPERSFLDYFAMGGKDEPGCFPFRGNSLDMDVPPFVEAPQIEKTPDGTASLNPVHGTKGDKTLAKAKPNQEEKPGKNALNVFMKDPKKSPERHIADVMHSPEFLAQAGQQPYHKEIHANELNVNDAMGSLKEIVSDVQKGDMSRPEAILMSQATTLDALFSALLRKASIQQHMPNYEAFMRMALKAQAQCSLTLRTLSEIKNPRQGATFVRQMNNAGQQVVNNNLTGAQETGKKQNELLREGESIEAMDEGGKTAAIEAHSRMDALGEIHRPQDPGREKEILPKCGQGRL